MTNKINDAIDLIIDKKILSKSQTVNIFNEQHLVLRLLKYGVNQDIIKNILSDFFGRESANIKEIEKFDKIYKSEFGYLINNDYYVPMNKYYNSNIFKKINKGYKGIVFNKIIIMSNYDLEKIDRKYLALSSAIKNKNTNILISNFIKIFSLMLREKTSRIFIDTRKDFYIGYHDAYKEKVFNDCFQNVNIEIIEKALSEISNDKGFYRSNEDYKIIKRKISDYSMEIEFLNYYEKSDNIKSLDNYGDIMNAAQGNTGLFVFSQQNNYGYFYDLLDELTVYNDKKILILSEDKRDNSATRKINVQDMEEIKSINSMIVKDFDVLMIENTNFLKPETFSVINLFLSNSKKVILFVTSKDAINSLGNLVYNYPELKLDILTEYLNGISHVSQLPKLCDQCKKPIKLIDVENVREDYKDLLSQYDKKTEIFIRNPSGCESCFKGYNGVINLEQFVRKTNGLVVGLTTNFNITAIKDSLSADNNYRSVNDKAENFVMKIKNLSIYDVKENL